MTLTAEFTTAAACHVCGYSNPHVLPAYAPLMRVTSDCKPWPAGGELCICAECGTVQKSINPKWQREIADIYAAYTIYFQGGGAEQAVFEAGTGEALLRSERLVHRMRAEVELPQRGRLLDFGCGNGAFLRACATAMPGWQLAGAELSNKYQALIEAIPGVEALYTGSVTEIPGRFTVVSLIHALEHVADPVSFLSAVRGRLEDGGLLFIEVPDATRNPFDLLVADHASHFSPSTLERVCRRAGFEVVLLRTDWVPKEISALCRASSATPSPEADPSEESAAAGLDWLLSVRDAARRAKRGASDCPFGLFGSSIAATWLAQELAGDVAFFVDEDPARRGSRFFDRPILPPSEVPSGAHVFVGLGGGLSATIAERLSKAYPGVTWYRAPALTPKSEHASTDRG